MLASLVGQVRPATSQEAAVSIPKRAAERRRTNKTTESGVSNIPTSVPVIQEDMDIRPVEMPAPGEKWHPDAIALYESFGHSGQRIFFEPSDWQRLRMTCDQLSQNLKPQFCGINEVTGEVIMSVKPMTGATLTAVIKSLAGSMASEGDRRLLRVELERGAKLPDADVTDADVLEFRAGITG